MPAVKSRAQIGNNNAIYKIKWKYKISLFEFCFVIKNNKSNKSVGIFEFTGFRSRDLMPRDSASLK